MESTSVEFIKPYAQLVFPETFHEAKKILKHIEEVGRVAYRSEDKIGEKTYSEFIRKIVSMGHTSVLEFGEATFKIVCSRIASHEIIRHRHTSYMQESTRYCNYSKEKFGRTVKVVERPVANNEIWRRSIQLSVYNYFSLVEDCGWTPQDARGVLPHDLATTLYMRCNFAQWVQFIKKRDSSKAYWEVRGIAKEIKNQLLMYFPEIFEGFSTNPEIGDSN